MPVLLSCVATLVLSINELQIIHSHHKSTLQNIMKLCKNTPESVIMFLAGSPGATATIHMRQLNICGMFCQQPSNILNKIARHKLMCEEDSSPSWFVLLRNICQKYNLPSPLSLLDNPQNKNTFKKLVKSKVIDYWESKFRADAISLPSLKYFNPNYMSLRKPHSLWTSCGNNSFDINKSIIVARLLSGRNPDDWLCRKWNKNKPEGHCTLCPQFKIPGTLEHLLVSCEALTTKREDLFHYWNKQTEDIPEVRDLLHSQRSSKTTQFVQFLIDPTVLPEVISGVQHNRFMLEDILQLTRTYCYGIHRKRQILLGRHNII